MRLVFLLGFLLALSQASPIREDNETVTSVEPTEDVSNVETTTETVVHTETTTLVDDVETVDPIKITVQPTIETTTVEKPCETQEPSEETIINKIVEQLNLAKAFNLEGENKLVEDETLRLQGKIKEVVVNSIGGEVRDLLPEEETLIGHICLSGSQFKYFQTYPGIEDASKYVLCDSWGKASVVVCNPGLLFDEMALKCVEPSERTNETGWWLLNLEKSLNSFDCNLPETSCLNNGECKKGAGGFYKCVCPTNFAGDFCEIKVDPSTVYNSILSGRFSFSEYREKLTKAMEKHKLTNEFKVETIKQYGEQGVVELEKYLSLHGKTELRYDQVMNTLVEDLLLDIYPDAYTLSLYNASNEKISNVIRFMPSLIAYAKYSNERNQMVFYEFQRALNKLVDLVKENCKWAPSRAASYATFVNTLAVLTNPSQWDAESIVNNNNINWSSETILENLDNQYKETSGQTDILLKMLSQFEKTAVAEIQKNPKIGELTLGQLSRPGIKQILEIFDSISRSSALVWDSLVGYGFWFVTNSIAN